MNKKYISIGLGLLVTGGFLLLALQNVQFSELGEVLSRARWRWIGVIVAICLTDLSLRALRWKLLLSQAATAPFWLLYKLEAVGLAVNNVLFMRLGELGRCVLAGRELGVPLPAVLSSVVIERAMDVVALLSLFSLFTVFLPELVSANVRVAALTVLSAAVCALALLIAAEGYLKEGGDWERLLRRWPKIHSLVLQLVLGAQALRSPRKAAAALALSLVLWLIDAAVYWAAAQALGLDRFIDYPRAVLILSWAGAASALPAAPGAIGTFEAMVKTIVETMGASAPEAFGYAVFCHVVPYLLVTTLGLIFLYRIGLSLAGLKAALTPSGGSGKEKQ